MTVNWVHSSRARRGLHGRIVETLGQRIIDGDLAPATVIEPEQLIHQLDVSRTVVREAIKVLSAKGLVDARPRLGTFVLAREHWNLLDADVIRWRNNGAPDVRLLVELEEVRQIIEPWGARLAARRRTEQDLADIEACLATMTEAADDAARGLADVRFHRAVLAAAHNELLERLELLLEPVLRARDELTLPHIHAGGWAETVQAHANVVASVRAGHEDDAFTAMNELLETAAADTHVSLGVSDEQPRAGRGRA